MAAPIAPLRLAAAVNDIEIAPCGCWRDGLYGYPAIALCPEHERECVGPDGRAKCLPNEAADAVVNGLRAIAGWGWPRGAVRPRCGGEHCIERWSEGMPGMYWTLHFDGCPNPDGETLEAKDGVTAFGWPSTIVYTPPPAPSPDDEITETLRPAPPATEPAPPITERATEPAPKWTPVPTGKRCYFCWADAGLCREHAQPPRVEP